MRLDPFQILVLKALATIMNLMMRQSTTHQQHAVVEQIGIECDQAARRQEI